MRSVPFTRGRASLRHVAALPLLGLIRLYQWFLSPFMGHACRFTPSCSHYGYEAIATHGPLPGLWLTLKRLARCHPWGKSGHDPVPPQRLTATQNSQ